MVLSLILQYHHVSLPILKTKKNHPFELAQTHHVMFLPNYLPQTCYLIFLHKNPPRETPPTNGNPLYSQYIRGLPSPKGPKISNPQPQGPRVPGTGQGGYDMDLVFRQEIGQRLLPRLQQHLKRWAINVGGRNKTWRGCEGWEYLCTSLYIYIYTANPGLLPRSRNNDYVPYDNNDNNNGNHNDNNKKKTYSYISIHMHLCVWNPTYRICPTYTYWHHRTCIFIYIHHIWFAYQSTSKKKSQETVKLQRSMIVSSRFWLSSGIGSILQAELWE